MRKAFSLLEILVVIAIIAVASAILFPVFAKAKRAAGKAVSTSNLHQCALALVIYRTDYDDRMPDYDSAKQVLARAPTCDPADNWHPGCDVPGERPLIGSYGYVFGALTMGWYDYWQRSSRATMLISIFYAPEHIDPVEGLVCLKPPIQPNPSRLLRVAADTSVSLISVPIEGEWGVGNTFGWPQLFFYGWSPEE